MKSSLGQKAYYPEPVSTEQSNLRESSPQKRFAILDVSAQSLTISLIKIAQQNYLFYSNNLKFTQYHVYNAFHVHGKNRRKPREVALILEPEKSDGAKECLRFYMYVVYCARTENCR